MKKKKGGNDAGAVTVLISMEDSRLANSGILLSIRGGFLNGIFFFFQAEDGIRDLIVTGVQTCALPISRLGRGVPNGDAVVRGEADIAVQQIPELISVAGTDLVGPLPRELQSITNFSAAVLSTCKDRKAASSLIEFLASPQTAAMLKAGGLGVALPGRFSP